MSSVPHREITELEDHTKPDYIGRYLDQMPEPVRDNIILRRKIWPRMHVKNENWMGIMCGEVGSGKSWAAVRMAEALDPNFSAANVAFNVEEFMELAANDDFGRGSIIVLDEAGVAAGNRKWYEVANEVLDYVTQTWRSLNRGAIMTAPDLDLIDSHVRRRFQHYIEMVSKDEDEMQSLAKIKFIQTNHEYGKEYRKFHRMIDDDGVLKKFRYIPFNPPTQALRDEYEHLKEDYSSDLRGSLLEQIRAENDDGEDELSPRDIAQQIIDDGEVGEYISESNGVEYFNRNLLKVKKDVSESASKQIKDFILNEEGLDVN